MSTALKNESLSQTRPQTARLPALLPTAAGATRLFFNRELSLLEFHRRVLEEALDPSNPVLERRVPRDFCSNLMSSSDSCVRLKESWRRPLPNCRSTVAGGSVYGNHKRVFQCW